MLFKNPVLKITENFVTLELIQLWVTDYLLEFQSIE